jgi:hypothetical protein
VADIQRCSESSDRGVSGADETAMASIALFATLAVVLTRGRSGRTRSAAFATVAALVGAIGSVGSTSAFTSPPTWSQDGARASSGPRSSCYCSRSSAPWARKQRAIRKPSRKVIDEPRG